MQPLERQGPIPVLFHGQIQHEHVIGKPTAQELVAQGLEGRGGCGLVRTQHTAHSTQHTQHTAHTAHSTQHTAHITKHTAHSTALTWTKLHACEKSSLLRALELDVNVSVAAADDGPAALRTQRRLVRAVGNQVVAVVDGP